ncbi:hypothetical protein BEWA_030000 [Theileria equi strain WA]|uniref:MIF4G domain-containing protein n=1 Tax=Theileria equi strain WA TaxID=1537102 RepID=L0AY02_THEEQ|nr:hypothetical protein BEWA_030000 [Theileria equi strain WA]AFZ80148.1 hypothetical protein BEWA_030000 [Theileria equi strain WA]|eukprot:XP_004829814.1 hypothetical protein BEWA_030000 [Theileria equi strain WA]
MDQVEVDIDDKADAVGYNDEVMLEGDPQGHPAESSVAMDEVTDAKDVEKAVKEENDDEMIENSRKRRAGKSYQPNFKIPKHRDFNRLRENRDRYAPGPYTRPSYYGGRNQDMPRFRGTDFDEMKSAEKKIITLLDSFSTAKEDIIQLAEVLSQLPASQNKSVISALMDCVESFPIKTAAYASVVGLLRIKGRSDLVEAVTQQAIYNFSHNLSSGNRTNCILLLRFLIGLHCSNVVGSHVFDVLSALLKFGEELVSQEYETGKEYTKFTITMDNIFYIVMASIPWFSRDVFASSTDSIKLICNKLFEYCDRRNAIVATLESDGKWETGIDLAVTTKSNPYAHKFCSTDLLENTYADRFSTGVEGIKSLLENDWVSSTTYRFYQSKGIVELLSSPVEESAEENKVTIDTLNILLQLDPKTLKMFRPIPSKPFPFSVDLDPSECLTKHDQWLLEEHASNIIQIFHDDSSQCATQLFNIPLNQRYKEYAIVDMLINMGLPSRYKHYYSLFGVMVVHNLCGMEERIEGIFTNFFSQLLAGINSVNLAVVNTIIIIASYWFSLEFCKIRKPENSEVKLDKEVLKEKNSKLFKLVFRPPGPCVHNYNARVLDKVSRLVYMDRLVTYSPKELQAEIELSIAPPIDTTFKDKPLEHKVFLNLLHFNKLNPEENELRNGRIIGFINNYTNRTPLKELPTHLFSENRTHDVEMDDALEPAAPASNEKPWTKDELVLIFWETLIAFGSKSLTHLLRLYELHAQILKVFESQDQDLPFEETTSCKVMLHTFNLLKRDGKRLELSFEFFIRKNVFSCIDVLKFLFLVLPNDDIVCNAFFFILHTLFTDIKHRLETFRESFKVASRDLAGTVAMEAKKQELDSAESDYYNLVALVVKLVDDKMKHATPCLNFILINVLKRVLFCFALSDTIFPRIFLEHPNVHDSIKTLLYQFSISNYF